MGRFSSLMLALLLGAVSAVALASCGGGSDAKLLPGTTASQIESNLDQVQTLVKSGDCVGAENAVAEVSAEVEELNGVAAKLKAALEEGTGRLGEVVSRCEEESEEETEQAAEADVEAEELETDELEAEEEKAEKAQEKAEKQEQKEEEKAEAPEVEEGNVPPPSEGEAKGKGKGHEEAPPPAAEGFPEEAESGGVSPGVGVE
jgi:septal ring factor EnvC (AmiA/AmiB activator)